MERVYLKKTSRLHSGHLWVFSNEIEGSLRRYQPGDIVELRDKKENFLGIGYINPHSLITIRILTKKKEEINRGFLEKRLRDALSYRERFLPNCYFATTQSSFRVVYSESDLLPGLIVDRYADWIVIQSLTAGMDRFVEKIAEILDQLLKPSTIFLKNDAPQRALECLELTNTFLKGSGESLPLIKEGEVILKVDPVEGQKTGFFLDQRENRLCLSGLINCYLQHQQEVKGLDLFCYSGAWGLQLAKIGAEVLFIDSSEKALGLAKENAEINGLMQRVSFLRADVFDYLTEAKAQEFDFIVLDPPAFVKSRQKIKEAIKGYRFINSTAMRLIKKGGLLCTSSCSHHISRETFLDILRSAAKDSGRSLRILEIRSQAKDHPILLQVPETEYLKCVIAQVV